MNFAEAKAKQKQKQSKQQITDLNSLMLSSEEPVGSKDDAKQVLRAPPSQFYVEEQVRTDITEAKIIELASTIESTGQIQPIVVFPADEEGPNKGKNKIDKGERRWRAISRLPGILVEYIIDEEAPKRNKRKRILGQVIENDQRDELKPHEMAKALRELRDDGMKMEEMALELGWLTDSGNPRTNKVSRILSILKMPVEGQNLARELIVTDLISLELLRKINEISPKIFSALCSRARKEGGLPRSRFEDAYDQCKTNQSEAEDKLAQIEQGGAEQAGSGQVSTKQQKPEQIGSGQIRTELNEPEQNEPRKGRETSNKPQQVEVDTPMPTLKVNWQCEDKQEHSGTLTFDIFHEDNTCAWILDENTGERVVVKLCDLNVEKLLRPDDSAGEI